MTRFAVTGTPDMTAVIDYDAAWDTWAAAGHEDCGGYKYDPGAGMISCACGEVIPHPAFPEGTAA
jgi:hypothetical protein